jgi:hypothetical protein
MLAPAEQAARVVDEPRRAEIVVGVPAEADAAEALRTGHRLRAQLGAAFPQRTAAVLLLSDRATEGPPPPPEGDGPRTLLRWSHPGQSALEAIVRAAETFDASACALVVSAGEDGANDATRHLLGPIVDDGYDCVCPCYTTHRFEGVLTTGIVYPLTRALFGKRLRQPIGRELAVSRRLAEHLLGEGWHADPAHAGGRLWLVTAVLSGEFKVCQSFLGRRRPTVEPEPDLAAYLARVVGLLFHEMRVHAPAWHRAKGSSPLPTLGDQPQDEGAVIQPQVAPMLSAFQLGYQELAGRVWGAVLPPQTLLALKRLAGTPEAAFALEDGLWARIVYDFAVGYHLAVMDRALLLRSMTPLYLGWTAGFVHEVRDLDAAGVEARVEKLCRAFEQAKPYLIKRWRWPDRFNP